MAYPDTDGTYGDLHLKDGRWLILHAPVGSGLPAKWVDDASVNTFMRDIGARRVSGSGDNMKIYGGEDDAPILNLAVQGDLDAFANLYRGVEGVTEGVGPRDVATSAYQQGAPINLKKLWSDIYRDIPFPDVYATNELGQLVKAPDVKDASGNIKPGGYVTDVSKYNAIIDALEARVGSLSRYGLDKDADYQVVNLGDEYDSDIIISDGKVTKIGKTDTATKPSFDPGLSKVGDDLKGYDVLQQRSGQLDPIKRLVDPNYIIDPKTMQPYFQQPDGSLQAAPVPSVDDQISMHLVEGNMDAAVTKANFRDRPSSLEYFNAAMEWARTPADIFTISAIVRGVIEPTPGPMGELRRVGAPPAWASQAWVGLQNSMGIPVESMTSGPGAEPGSVNEMMVASSSGLVPNNFASPNSAPTTLDGGRTITQAASTITPSTPVTATTSTGQTVNTTAGLAYREGLNFEGDNNLSSDFLQEVPTTPTTPTTTETLTEHEALLQLGEENPNILDTNSEEFNLDAFNAAFYEGSFNQKIDGILATGATVKPGGGFIHPDGREWDINGSPIKTPVEPDGSNEINVVEQQPNISSGNNVIKTGPNQPTAITGDALRQLYIDLGRDPDTGLEYEYGTHPDDMLVESEADRGSAISFADAISAADQARMEPIDYDSEGGFGSETSIGNTWAQRMAAREEADRIERERWADVLSGDTSSDFTGQSSYAGAVMPDYSSQPVSMPQPAAVGYDYASEGGSLLDDIQLEHQRFTQEAQIAKEEANKRLAAEIIEREQRWRDTVNAEADWIEPEPVYYPEDDIYADQAEFIPEPQSTAPEPVYEPVTVYEEFEEDAGSGYQYIDETDTEPISSWGASQQWYGEGAKGTRTDDRFTLVGEEGPELALFPRGTEIIPLNRPTKPKQRRRLRNQFSDAIDSFAFGGFSSGGPALVGEMGPELVDLPPGAQVMPAGITEMMTGRPTRAPRSLFRQAGMRAPSAQTIANLLPEEIEVYQEMGRLAGIPDKAFEREFRSMVPMGQGGTRQARFTPRGTGRTRYGSI